MPSEKRRFGDIGENEAERFLLQKGFKIVGKNYRIKNIGEIDLIAVKGGQIVFFEVKTRNVKRGTNFPIEFSINKRKLSILKKICHLYLIENKLPFNQKWRVDGLFIEGNPEN